MSDQPLTSPRALPDSLIGLLPVTWKAEELDQLSEIHPQIWGEPLERIDRFSFRIGEAQAGEPPLQIRVDIDEAIPELNEMTAAAKHPFSATETLQLENHRAIWRVTLPDVSKAPLARARGFARVIITAAEAGAPGVFFPFCAQLHPAQLLRHLSVEMKQPATLTNLYVGAFNDDQWMVTRGLTALGLPELETTIDAGLNAAYFRLLDVATAMIAQEDAYPGGARLQLGPHLYTVEPGGAGPADLTVSVCGAFGRMVVRREGAD